MARTEANASCESSRNIKDHRSEKSSNRKINKKYDEKMINDKDDTDYKNSDHVTRKGNSEKKSNNKKSKGKKGVTTKKEKKMSGDLVKDLQKNAIEVEAVGTPKIHNRTNKELVEREEKKMHDHKRLEQKRKSGELNGNPKNPKQIKPAQSDVLKTIHRFIKCGGGKENKMPTLMEALRKAEENAARETVTTWVNTKSNQLLQSLNPKKAAPVPSAPTFREMLIDFQSKADKRNNPSELLPEEKYLVLNYLGLFSDCSEYNKITVQNILLDDKGVFRPMLLRLPPEQLWTWLWSFLITWISLAYHIIGEEELNEKDVFRFLFLEEALFSVEKYFSRFWMQDFNTLCKDMQTLQDGTVAFASHVTSLKSDGKSCENDDLDWREIFKEAPSDLTEKLHHYFVQQDMSAKVKVKKENESASKITGNSSQIGYSKPEPILSRKTFTFGEKSGDKNGKGVGRKDLNEVKKENKSGKSASNINSSQGRSATPEPIPLTKKNIGRKEIDDGRKDLNEVFDAVHDGMVAVKKEKVATKNNVMEPGQWTKTKKKLSPKETKKDSNSVSKGTKNQFKSTKTKAVKQIDTMNPRRTSPRRPKSSHQNSTLP